MAIVVVAMTFVSDARSYGVCSVTSGDASNVSVPTASDQIAAAPFPTSAVADGNTRAALASTSTSCARVKPVIYTGSGRWRTDGRASDTSSATAIVVIAPMNTYQVNAI